MNELRLWCKDMKNLRGIVTVLLALCVLWLAVWWAIKLETSVAPAPSASVPAPKFKSDIVDTRTDVYARFRAESDKWHEERGRFARLCYESKGVPVFTFEMRLFCISRDVGETRIVGGGPYGEPDRPAPEFPVGAQ